MMTVSDYPKYLAVGYLLNQNMITKRTKIEKIDYDDDLNVVVVRTKKNKLSRKLKKKIVTSGCAQGTIFGDLMENFKKIKFTNKSIIKGFLDL